MSETLGQHDFDQLLDELEQRVRAHSALSAELEEGLETFLAGNPDDPPTRLRFREWFLIERDARQLGVPPIVAWAPEDLQEGDIWQRLLESFFGIFQPVAAATEAHPILEDLWSGRQIRLDRPLPAHDEDMIVVGRAAQGSEDAHVLLPGCVFLAASGLVDALASDLSRIRAEQPRSRLSQRECERLLLPFRAPGDADQEIDAAIEILETALAGEAHWDADRLLEEAVESGVTEALNRLAFDTKVELDPIRSALATLKEAGARAAVDDAVEEAKLDDSISPGQIESALAAYDLARTRGEDLDQSFKQLEQALGLDVGESDPFHEVTAAAEEKPGEVMGPEEVPGMSMWLATFLWEQEAAGVETEETVAREITAFLEHLFLSRGPSLDPDQVEPGDLLGYLLRAQDIAVLEQRLDSLTAFITWLVEQQDAPLGDTLVALKESTGALLREVVTLNQRLESDGADKDSVAWLKTVTPLQVGAEDGDLAAVVGVPKGCSFEPQVGDCLMGSWHGGRFQLGAWLPEKLLPMVPETAE
jgi:hypothetical protein